MPEVSLEDSRVMGILQENPAAMDAYNVYKTAFREGTDGAVLGAKMEFKKALTDAGVEAEAINGLADAARDMIRDTLSCRSCGTSFTEQLGQSRDTGHGVSAAFN